MINVKPLKGWLLVTDVAAELGVSRQSVHKMIVEGRLKSTHVLGPPSAPIYVIREKEVDRVLAQRRREALLNGRRKA